MTILESLFSDAMLALMRSPTARWGTAFAVSLLVWIAGRSSARFRSTYIVLPFIAAAAIEILDSRFFSVPGQKSGWFPLYLWSGEAFRKLASWIGLAAMALAVFLGYLRGFGFLLTLAGFAAAYVAEPLLVAGVGMFSFALVGTVAALMPAVLMVLLSFYGFGALIRSFKDRRFSRDY